MKLNINMKNKKLTQELSVIIKTIPMRKSNLNVNARCGGSTPRPTEEAPMQMMQMLFNMFQQAAQHNTQRPSLPALQSISTPTQSLSISNPSAPSNVPLSIEYKPPEEEKSNDAQELQKGLAEPHAEKKRLTLMTPSRT